MSGLISQCLSRLMLFGNIVAHDQYAGYFTIITINRDVTISPPDIFERAISSDGDKPFLIPGRPLTLHDEFDLGANDIPDFCPAIATALAERTRMSFWP
jgi:hypothetical protein